MYEGICRKDYSLRENFQILMKDLIVVRIYLMG